MGAFPQGLILHYRKPLWGKEQTAEVLAPFYSCDKLYSCQTGRASRFCVFGEDIMGYVCVRGGKGLLRLLHLSAHLSLQDVSHVCH